MKNLNDRWEEACRNADPNLPSDESMEAYNRGYWKGYDDGYACGKQEGFEMGSGQQR